MKVFRVSILTMIITLSIYSIQNKTTTYTISSNCKKIDVKVNNCLYTKGYIINSDSFIPIHSLSSLNNTEVKFKEDDIYISSNNEIQICKDGNMYIVSRKNSVPYNVDIYYKNDISYISLGDVKELLPDADIQVYRRSYTNE